MPKMKFLEKVLLFILTVVFITTFFFSTIISLKPIDEDVRFFIIGIIILAINLGTFFYSVKILKRHFGHRDHKRMYIFYSIIMILPLFPTLGFLRFYNNWPYMIIYFLLIAFYYYVIAKEFGRLSIRIQNDQDELYAGDFSSMNGDILIRGKNKKLKGSTERIAIGDTITIKRGSETIITLNVIKNVKKP